MPSHPNPSRVHPTLDQASAPQTRPAAHSRKPSVLELPQRACGEGSATAISRKARSVWEGDYLGLTPTGSPWSSYVAALRPGLIRAGKHPPPSTAPAAGGGSQRMHRNEASQVTGTLSPQSGGRPRRVLHCGGRAPRGHQEMSEFLWLPEFREQGHG